MIRGGIGEQTAGRDGVLRRFEPILAVRIDVEAKHCYCPRGEFPLEQPAGKGDCIEHFQRDAHDTR